MTTHSDAVRSFDHTNLAALKSYGPLRQALSDLANQANGAVTLAEFLDAVRDMALTAPYADCCTDCRDRDPEMTWPHAVDRSPDGWLTCHYRCRAGHVWTCGYAATLPEILG